MMINVSKMFLKYLRERGYTGIYSHSCGCSLKDPIPCGSTIGELDSCYPGVVIPANEEQKKEGWDFWVVPKVQEGEDEKS